ncbi:DUF742 domain-containing protein [Micromonospora sp. HNM0581]|uniref:DUF742 domain-containing protein n=1 Tax=Micromonospora sp. HNM0581 TaxID=2716341 RepID=UPI00146AB5F5|nr:DUF742 domain-containing protein [Micromonospora sp. HNM0581]NLU80570.1 DUF742 domain-containing protein [Micromonospora sp. HNM0581]
MRPDVPGYRHEWLDDDAGPVVRPYTLTGGRARPSTDGLDMVAYVSSKPDPDLAAYPELHPEHRLLVELAGRGTPVVELAADLDLAVGVVRVLLGDLLSRGLVAVHQPSRATYLPDNDILKAVVDGLRAL